MLRTHAGPDGYAVAQCDSCPNTIAIVGAAHAEEKVKSNGWTVRHGKARCPACSEGERMVLARAVRRTWSG